MTREDIREAMDLAFENGIGNSSVASAYFLEAIAKMMYLNTFHENYVADDKFEDDQEVEDVTPEEETVIPEE